MKVTVPIKTLFILNEILSKNHHLARQITSLAPKGELPLADLCSCLDKVTSQLISLESEYFRISLQEASQRVRDAVVSGKFYKIREIPGQTTKWVPECLDNEPIVEVEMGGKINYGFDDRSKLDQQMFNNDWVFVPEYLL